MKELEKTKRISISAVLFLLAILIGFLTFKKPEFSFKQSASETLEFVNRHEYVMSLPEFKKLQQDSFQLIDVRNNHAYTQGHMDNAINIPSSQILDHLGEGLNAKNSLAEKPLILYAENPEMANISCLLLFQMGYKQIKLLSIETNYDDKLFKITPVQLEKPLYDYAETMKKASIQPIKKVAQKPHPKPKKKKVIMQPKKKKKMPEGGC